MFDFATAWLLQNKVLLPAASTLYGSLVKRERASPPLWRNWRVADSWQTAQLTGLLEIPEGQRSVLEQRKDPVTISGPAFTEALERYLACAAWNFPA
jgi:hypothetical protein